ncbi:putative bifunctional diguanylate cyclase/phosphodiesterase [Mycolicibacterium sp. CBM1]
MQTLLGNARAVRYVTLSGLMLLVAAVALSHSPSFATIATFKITLTIVAAAVALLTVRTAVLAQGRIRAAWLALAVGLAAFATGAGVRGAYAVVGAEPAFPVVPDLVRLILPASACVALLLLPIGAAGTSWIRLLLDAVVVAGSVVIVVWTGVLENFYPARLADWGTLVASVAYPTLDSLLLTIVVLVFLRALPMQRLPIGLMALAGFCIVITNDVTFYYIAAGQYSSHRVVAVGWLAGLLIFGAVAVVGRPWPHRNIAVVTPPGPASVFLPFVPVAAAAVVATFNLPPPDELRVPLTVAGGLVVVAFLARQLIIVGENRRLFAAVAEQALRDPLTGLDNRAVFHDRVSHAMQMRQRDGVSVGVMALDLDGFKLVNDTFGHDVGDKLLQHVGERMLKTVRTGDTVARVGGDEYAVLIEGRDDHSQVVAQRVAESFAEPFQVGGHELMIRPSAGLAVADAEDLEVSTAELLKRADIALDAAKKSRVAGVHTFTAEMEADFFADGVLNPPPLTTAGGRGSSLRLLGELRQAVDQRNLTLLYQPTVDLRTLEIVAAEALVRWPHPTRGVLGPMEFMPLVRRHGLMGAVTDQVVNQALDDAKVWHDAGFTVPVAVNVSAPSLATARLATTVSSALMARGLTAAAMSVEITEDVFLEGLEQTTRVLHELRAAGIRIAIDDFGSGYSALSYLRDLPIDQVKLDRRFVAPVTGDTRAAVVVRAVVNMAHELGLSTVAEGIERVDTLERLREYGCDVGQGYYFSVPVELDRLLAMLANPPWGPASARSS